MILLYSLSFIQFINSGLPTSINVIFTGVLRQSLKSTEAIITEKRQNIVFPVIVVLGGLIMHSKCIFALIMVNLQHEIKLGFK